MTITFFTDCWFPTKNGVTTATLQLAEALRARGHRVVIVAPDGGPSGPDLIRVPSWRVNRTLELRGALPFPAAAAAALAAANTDVIHTHTEFTLGRAGRALARRRGIPWVHSFHTAYGEFRHYLGPLRVLPVRTIAAYLAGFARGASALVFPSPKARRYYDFIPGGMPRSVIPNGVDLQRFSHEARRDGPERRLLYVGRLAPEKRVRQLVAALGALLNTGEYSLRLVGDGPDWRALAGTPVTLTGPVHWADMPAIYRAADAFITASLSEMHPMTALEAAASGLPIIGRRDEAFEGLLMDGDTGVFADEDVDLAPAVRSVLEDAPGWHCLSRGAVKAAQAFSAEAAARRLEDLYGAIRLRTLRKKSGPSGDRHRPTKM